jgi:hypothetical protein
MTGGRRLTGKRTLAMQCTISLRLAQFYAARRRADAFVGYVSHAICTGLRSLHEPRLIVGAAWIGLWCNRKHGCVHRSTKQDDHCAHHPSHGVHTQERLQLIHSWPPFGLAGRHFATRSLCLSTGDRIPCSFPNNAKPVPDSPLVFGGRSVIKTSGQQSVPIFS